MSQLEAVACGVCGSQQFHHLFHAHDYIYGNNGAWPVAQCDGCGVVFMNPRIPPAEISNYYPKDYYTNAGIHDPERMTWQRVAKDESLERFWGYKLSRQDPLHYRVLGQLLLPWTKRWTATNKYITPVQHGRVLDLGCGNGQWLSEYERLGWEAVGVEPDAEAAQVAIQAGHSVVVGLLTDTHFPDASFDAVTMWDALEHIPNPSEVMREVYRILKPGGKVYISVPNFGGWYGRTFRDRWFMFTAPVHYYHYSAQTLTYLLSKAEFKNIVISYPLGDAGLRFTLRTAAGKKTLLRKTIDNGLVWKGLSLLDMVLPYGHLLATAGK